MEPSTEAKQPTTLGKSGLMSKGELSEELHKSPRTS